MLGRYFVPYLFLLTSAICRIPSSWQTVVVPASSPTKMTSISGCNCCQLKIALRCITSICPIKGLGVENRVSMSVRLRGRAFGRLPPQPRRARENGPNHKKDHDYNTVEPVVSRRELFAVFTH